LNSHPFYALKKLVYSRLFLLSKQIVRFTKPTSGLTVVVYHFVQDRIFAQTSCLEFLTVLGHIITAQYFVVYLVLQLLAQLLFGLGAEIYLS
jgi:hypothetical protein